MSEKQKMLAGELYNASDGELILERKQAFSWMKTLNDAFAMDDNERLSLLRQGLGSVGDNVTIRSPFYCDYGYNISIGKDVFINFNCVILDGCSVEIGDGCEIAPNVQIVTATHPTDAKLREQKLEYGKPIKIGKNVWIGAGSIILPGVTIGDGATIGAASLVTRDIPANCTAFGSPARVR
ncbi:sugar O-acetyltransferase [Bartonella sp. HY761]|uniref:sugar O-acetyltransferase n=1 Tax=Bartonella sp. HY761 TaxID=2979330 RepID=UPI0022019A1C|nr:sugar O-acetyltransferase [Bartonella sp. HY761]UXN06792.1 sugar O-acetyltransferase [Bartonella sp. HY761]